MLKPIDTCSINAMEITTEGNTRFFLFLDLFVHHSAGKITACAPFYGEDISWPDQGVDLENVILNTNGLSIPGKYIPHRLDSWEPAVLFDFEHADLAALIETNPSIEVEIIAGTHKQTFTLATNSPLSFGVTMSVIIKNENRWIRSYLDYYLYCMGVEHIFVYDNLTPPHDELAELLAPYVLRNQVTFIPWAYRWRNEIDKKQIGQPPQQSHTLNRFGNSTWIGFFDVDEFLRIPGKTLPEFLNDYDPEEVDGLSFGLRWFMHKGKLEFDDIKNPLFCMFESKRDALGRKRQKLMVAAKNVRFLRFHWLEEGKTEQQIPDDEIFFHHYYLRKQRFEEGKQEPETQRDDFMLRFASDLAPLNQVVRQDGLMLPKPETRSQWIAHLEMAVLKGGHHLSKLNQQVLDIYGMSGLSNRHFLNSLCGFEGARYLEIGALAGASLCSAIYKNKIEATVIDDWSQFTRPKEQFHQNLENFGEQASVTVIEADCFNVDPESIGPVNIFFYDGEHSEQSQYAALMRFFPVLENLSIIIVDDWNWPQVRAGTRRALDELNANIVYEKEIILRDDEVADMPRHQGRHTWWNGLYLAIIEKNLAPVAINHTSKVETNPVVRNHTEVIVLSKDRACQLEALLRTKEKYLHIPHSTTIQYTTSTDDFELGYQELMAEYPDVKWVRETAFREDILNLISHVDRQDNLMFLVDDIIFTRPYGGGETLRALNDEDNVLAVSLRLGDNITWCHPRQMTTVPPDLSKDLRWEWRTAHGGYWNYPMSVDGNIFRARDLVDLIPTLPFKEAGELEAAMAGKKLEQELMICNRHPALVNLAINKVQTSFNNPHGNISADFLNARYLEGSVIDVSEVIKGQYDSCHIEPSIRLIPRIERNMTKKVNLQNITFYVINCPDETERKTFMSEQLTERGLKFEFIRGIVTTPTTIGQALSHLRTLKRSDLKAPFVILEDDAEFTDAFKKEIEVPANADALYLGISAFGIETPGKLGWGVWNVVERESYANGYQRIRNMLSQHAILFLTDEYHQAVIDASLDAIADPDISYPGDVGCARLQEDFLVLTPERPFCVQAERFSSSYEATRDQSTRVSANETGIENVHQDTGKSEANGKTDNATGADLENNLPQVFFTGSGHRPRHPQFQTPDPGTFYWVTNPDQEGCVATVYVNSAIKRQVNSPDDRPGKNIAWISESPAIAEKLNVNLFLQDNVEDIAKAFDVVLMCDRNLCDLHDKFKYHPSGSNLPWIHEYEMYEKNKLCSMFISPKQMVPGHFLRHQLAEKYKDSLDLYGGPLNSKHLPSKHEGMLPYMFSITMENCKNTLYYTEKLTDCFATGTIPVYWGAPDIGEVFDMDGIIILDDQFDIGMLTPELYKKMKPAAENNLQIVESLESSFDELYRLYIK